MQTVVGLVTTLSVFIGNEIQVVNIQSTQEQAYITQTIVPEPREYLRELAGPDFELLDRIVYCESGWKSTAQNKTSTAGGLFQFIDSTWAKTASLGWDKYNSYDNIKAGVILFNSAGPDPWLASKSCWSMKTTQ